MVQFIRRNAPAEGWTAGIQLGAQQAAADERDFRERAKFTQGQNVDAAVRRGIGSIYMPTGQPAATNTPPATNLALPSEPEFGGAAMPSERPAATPVRGGPYDAAIGEMVKTPGAGDAALRMHQANVAAREKSQVNERARTQAEIQLFKALDAMDPRVAEGIARKYNVNIPPEVLRDRGFQREMKELGDQIKASGITDDGAALSIRKEYLKSRKSGADQPTAWSAAFENTQAPSSAKASDWIYDANRGAWVRRPSAAGGSPEASVVAPTGLPPRAASAGGGSRAQQYAEWRLQTLVQAGMPEAEAKRIVAGGSALAVGQKDVTRLASNLMKVTDRLGKPLYKTLDEAMAASRDALGAQQPAPAPSALVPPAPSGAPEGARQIGTSGGKPVYELPDGRRVVEE